MKAQPASRPWLLAPLLLAPVLPLVAAEPDAAPRVQLGDPQPPTKNRFGVSYRAGFNISAEFKNVASVAHGPSDPRGPGPATGGGIDRFYDDGYNRVDISGNKDGLTWFWGAKNQSQVQGDQLLMHSSSASTIDSKSVDADVSHGFELTYNRELGRGKKGNWAWGVEGAFGWMNVSVGDNRPLSGGVKTIEDAYNLGGVGVTAPYNGDYEGPGTLIEDAPNRTTTSNPNGTLVTGSRGFEADLFSFRLGPYVDLPINEKWSVGLSGGLALGVMDGEFSFDQLVAAGSSVTHQVGSVSHTDVLIGGYVSATLRYAINPAWSVFIGGQFVSLSDYTAKAGGQKVVLDLSATAFATAGVSYSF